MATKTISISEDAYDILKAKKESSESFSEVIVRMSGKKNLSSFYGALSKESADALEKAVAEIRKKHSSAHAKRIR